MKCRTPTLLATLALLLATAACQRDAPATQLAFDQPIPNEFPAHTRLALGDPQVRKQLTLMGELDKLPFSAEWANISGGPDTIQAFRAGALDGGSVGDTPPIHAAFTGLDIKIIMVSWRDKPIYRLVTAPGTNIESLSDLRGKRIGYSPGQAMGALVQRVLEKTGISQQEVKLVELNGTEYRDALAARQIDVAPLGGVPMIHFLSAYGAQGARALEHGVQDSLTFFYVRSEVLQDPHKAAALRAYVKARARAQLWAQQHRDVWTQAFYVKDQGLPPEKAESLVQMLGGPRFPNDWSEAIRLTQETVDMMAAAAGRKPFDANTIFDRRFERLAADVAAETSAQLTLPKGDKP
ncbi:MAG TPA: ABC transporter substrate-binding protein [Polyangiales bacterium]|nr:ABC transporter substrate-binding protein [Polyangiales bacterium]